MSQWSQKIVSLALLGLVACTPAAPTATAPAPIGPQLAEKQTLSVGYTNIAPTMDPHLTNSGSYRRYDIFETLIVIDESGKNVEPLLATDWKVTDRTTWRFNVRKDAKFQDGSPLTTDDVVFSWQRVNVPELKSPVPGVLPTVADMVKVDQTAFDIKTKTPDPILLKRLASFAIVPKAYVQHVGNEEFAKKPIGSGPYTLKEFRADDRVVLSAWTEHAYRKPKLTEISIRVIPDIKGRAQGVQVGELDLAHQLSIDSIAPLRSAGFTVTTRSTAINGIFLDTWGTDGTNIGPIADKRVRQALLYSIDREAMVRTMFHNIPKPGTTPLLEGWFGYNPDVKPYTYDVRRAKELLAQAGYPNGFKTSMEYWNSSSEVTDMAVFVQAAFKEIGVELELISLDFALWREKLNKVKPPAPLFMGGTGVAPLMDPESTLLYFWSENKGSGRRYNNPAYDKVYLESREELDVTKREALVKQAVALLQEDPPFLGLFSTTSVTAYPKTVAGVKPRPSEGDWSLFDEMFRTR